MNFFRIKCNFILFKYTHTFFFIFSFIFILFHLFLYLNFLLLVFFMFRDVPERAVPKSGTGTGTQGREFGDAGRGEVTSGMLRG